MGINIKLWGTRGSISAPGSGTVKVGGNTTCVEVTTQEERRIIIDAGTGIRLLGNKLRLEPLKPICLLLTHSHWDHLSGFTFFAPAFDPEQVIDIYGNRMAQEVLQRDIFDRQDNRYSPVNRDNLRAQFKFIDELPAPFFIGSVEILTLNLNHPGNGYAFRFNYSGRSLAFVTDNEIGREYPGGHNVIQLMDFCRGADLLIHDAQYLPSELANHRGWGHSSYEEVIDLARDCGVRQVLLTHHDPERNDEQCEQMLSEARDYVRSLNLSLNCDLAIEGREISL